jgi:hypothetical protein
MEVIVLDVILHLTHCSTSQTAEMFRPTVYGSTRLPSRSRHDLGSEIEDAPWSLC